MPEYEGRLANLLSTHEFLKTSREQFAKDFRDEMHKAGTVPHDRYQYMSRTLNDMDTRIEDQKKFFEKFDMPMTLDEVHAFNGGHKDEEWTVGHPRFGRHS
jgi:hypothetical protein